MLGVALVLAVGIAPEGSGNVPATATATGAGDGGRGSEGLVLRRRAERRSLSWVDLGGPGEDGWALEVQTGAV